MEHFASHDVGRAKARVSRETSWRIPTVRRIPPCPSLTSHPPSAHFPLKRAPIGRGWLGVKLVQGRDSGGGLEAADCALSPEGGPELASLRRPELKLILATLPPTTPTLCPNIIPSLKGPLRINCA